MNTENSHTLNYTKYIRTKYMYTREITHSFEKQEFRKIFLTF